MRLPLAILFLVLTGFPVAAIAAEPPPSQRAAELFKAKNWAEARAAYDEGRTQANDWRSEPARQAVEGAVACAIQLQQWDDATARMEDYIAHTRGAFEEALGLRFLGGLYLTMPHHGLKQGGKFLRGQSGQGTYVYSWRKDRKDAVERYERARDLVIWLTEHFDAGAGNPDTPERRQRLDAERIDLDFDLATALSQSGDNPFRGWMGWWWQPGADSEENSDAVEEADYEEPRNFYSRSGEQQEPPTGIPLGPDGQPQFLPTPDAYAATLGAGPKIRFLLEEIQRLDASATKEDAAKALFRRAMIARSLYGPETAQGWRNNTLIRYDRMGNALPATPDPDAPREKLWELSDDQTITLAGGRARLVNLPAMESPVALLRQVEAQYPQSAAAPEALYARALYFQTRQQFPRALAEYAAFLERYPQHPRAADARAMMEKIQKPGVLLGQSSVFLAGDKPKLAFTFRNAEKIEFKALRFDMARYVSDRLTQEKDGYWNYHNIGADLFNNDLWKKYLVSGDKNTVNWSETPPRAEDSRALEGATLAPLGDPGAYVVEARTPGESEPSRVLALVTDIAIVQKNAKDFGLIYVCDARTGQPLTGKAVRVYEHWSEYIQTTQKSVLHQESSTLVTDEDGVVKFKRKHSERGSQVSAVVTGDKDRMAFSFFQYWNEAVYVQDDYWFSGARNYVVTDRPVYRPGSTVKFRAWVRRFGQSGFGKPEPGQTVQVKVYDAKSIEIESLALKTDALGGIAGEFQLGAEPPLGIYRIDINDERPDARRNAGGLFRVEEYRKPEFEVEVKPSTTQARLGEKFKAKIEARYYFGAPVARGKISYKVFRENYEHVYFGPGEYDWLYGKGYGRVPYAYPWLPWWGRWGGFIVWDGPWPGARGAWQGYQFPWGYYGEDAENYWPRRWEGAPRKALRELVAQGEAELNADGSYEVEVDTARAKAEQGNRDHRYTIEAEVRDASRRTVEGKGSIVATRQEFYAFVETDCGWYTPQNETRVEVRALTPDNTPVAAKGEVVVARIRYSGANNEEAREEELKRWDAETDAEGRLSFTYPIPGEGQYRITFKARDSWKEEVQGNAVFWVRGPKFDGRIYRFNDLEIISDKRSYKIGEVAHLLVNAAENHSRILFSDNVSGQGLLSYRFIDMESRSMVVDVPVDAGRTPNFFVEATLVRNGRVHTESRELFVPPTKGLLNLSIKTDKPVYQPGEKGTIHVEATDLAGKPVAGEVALTAYDEAVTYIQDEFGPGPRVFFYGQKRYHEPQVNSSFEKQFNATNGNLRNPENEIYGNGSPPEGWSGTWALRYGTATNGGGGGGGGFGGGELTSSLRVDAVGKSFSGKLRSGTFALRGKDENGSPSGAADVTGVGAATMATATPASQRPLGEESAALADGSAESRPGGGEAARIEPEIRANFADTALWLPSLKLDKNGAADAEITFPQSLTSWRVHGYAMNAATQVGDFTAKAATTKKMIVRLQSPRFFIERDEATLSANVNNYLPAAQSVKAELIVPAALFQYIGETVKSPTPDEEGNLHLFAQAEVEAKGEHRFDWPVRALKSGLAKITVKALTAEESDGMRLAFPVLVHGVNKTLAQSGSYRVGQDGERKLQVELPAEIDPEQTRLELTLSPSLAGVMIDALPYLADYPYGCVEQTMSRFYPTVLVKDTLGKMGVDLETIAKQRQQMNSEDLRHRFRESPVFDSGELDRMVKEGLQRIYAFQRNDGGWGWWREDDSSLYQTAYVLQGLSAARGAGVKVDDGVYSRGFQFLQNSLRKELEKPKNEQDIGGFQVQAYLAYILSLEGRLKEPDQRAWLNKLYEQRGELNNYGRALLALAMFNEKRGDEAKALLRNLLQFAERDDSNETAWIRTPEAHWWFWWNNDIETNAWALKALAAIDPQNDLAPRLVKWLLNNRRGGYYWRSTRDTAQTIAAMSDYMRATGESAPDYALSVSVDGVPVKEIRVNKENLFAFDNRVLLQGLQIKPGRHEITVQKNGAGALYYSSYLSYFTKEEDVKGAGNEIFVEREYFRLVPKTEAVRLPEPGAVNALPAGQNAALEQTGRSENRAGYTRVPLKTGDEVASGERIEVVLKITAKNTYDYLAFEDMKPAGFEPVELRSGGRWAGGLCANLELRDAKVVFFIGLLEQGQHILRYQMRAETPGHFHALPAMGSAMYAPEVRGISDEMRLRVRE